MSRFGSDPQAFFDGVYRSTPPWDIGGPQPALDALIDTYPPDEPILDVGCGSGDLAIALAQRGYRVYGIDIVGAAIAAAQQKAALLPEESAVRVSFAVADALHPVRLQRSFGAVMDSGFLHLFDPKQGDRFIDEVAAILPPGGRYYLLAFDVEFDIPNVPRRISMAEVQTRFRAERGWRLLTIHEATFHNRVALTPATCACAERI